MVVVYWSFFILGLLCFEVNGRAVSNYFKFIFVRLENIKSGMATFRENSTTIYNYLNNSFPFYTKSKNENFDLCK